MMNNQFNTNNISTPHGLPIAQAQHVATSPPQASAAVLNTFLNTQQQQQQFAAAVSAGTMYTDPRHLHLNTNNMDKSYYTTTAATLSALGTPQRFYTTAGPTAAGSANNSVATTGVHHPNTILITNNFTHQQMAQPLNNEAQRNIRIVTSVGTPLNTANTGNLSTTASGFQHSQHVFNINSDKQLQHLFPQHLLQQQNFQTAAAAATTTTELLPQHFTTQHFSATQQPSHATASSLQMPQFYVSSENTIAPIGANQKIITNIPSNTVTTSATGNTNNTNNTNASNSTVVLDRINICINNLYTDTSSSSSASNSLASTPAQQPSPIIPAIQHKAAVIESGLALHLAADIYESNALIIDEPDSTTTATTPHTPPTTPENSPPSMPNNTNRNNNNIISTTSLLNSPSTSSYNNHQQSEKLNAISPKHNFASVAQSIEKAALDSPIAMDTSTTDIISESIVEEENAQTTQNITSNSPLTPPTPPSPIICIDKNKNYQIEDKLALTYPPAPLFSNGEDVFIKRHDGRFYLGTVIDTARNQFLVRFDDKTEIWCNSEEMRKLGGSSNNNNNTTSTEDKTSDQPMCVACKRSQPDSKVEICERCGRGYHRKCTTETLPGSDIWLCKRCAKPMKLDDYSKFSSTEEETEVETGHQLHYNIESLTWDAKHRMNLEQIYCYCGKTGKFDNNMLQCWRCLNWYHTYCIKKFRGNILRGDCFFIFCCTVCNGGVGEYLRRLQANWVDLVHLALYCLSTAKKHQKYYHLLKDINPFVLEKRKMFPIPKEWMSLPEKQFLDKIKLVLNENTELFMCGKEVKRDHNLYALRTIEPPLAKKIHIKSQDTLNDHFVFNVLKLQVLRDAPENADIKYLSTCSKSLTNTSPKSNTKITGDYSSRDVYEFDDTSDDDVPIKHKLDKIKKRKVSSLIEPKAVSDDKTNTTPSKTISSTTTLEEMDVDDDNANDTVINHMMPDLQSEKKNTMNTTKIEMEQMPKREDTSIGPKKCSLDGSKRKEDSLNINHMEKSSRKRKAFKLSNSYNDTRSFDSSSDENSSSSSRGTSLDLIIPPPKNFLGQNNPFRIISPKKNAIDPNAASTSCGKKSVSFGIFNATGLNFSSKLAGLFPKLSTTNLAKAAGQPRTVRTIKRRLSAKDITIGPNKEVRRRRTRRLSSNIEIISTTTINPIPTNFFPIQAKDLLAAAAATTTNAASLFTITQKKTSQMLTSSSSASFNNINSSASSSSTTESINMQNTAAAQSIPTHGRRLRQRPQRNSPNTSRRSSISSNQSTTSSASAGAVGAPVQSSHEDLKQTVNKYFGIVNRIESGEQFSIRAKRQLPNGQMQYLIEWGEAQLSQSVPTQTHSTNTITTITTDQQTIKTDNSKPDEISTT